MRLSLPLLAVVLFAGCASKFNQAVSAVSAVPSEKQPAAIKQQRELGRISEAEYQEWIAAWQAKQDEKAALAQMTPKERADYNLRKRSVELQEQQLALAESEAETGRIRHITGAAATSAANNAAIMNDSANAQAIASGQ